VSAAQALAAQMIAALAEEVIRLNRQVRELDKLIEERFHRHGLPSVIDGMPGIGPPRGTEFLAATCTAPGVTTAASTGCSATRP
jgi:transposase